jgi:hypothetical protein
MASVLIRHLDNGMGGPASAGEPNQLAHAALNRLNAGL